MNPLAILCLAACAMFAAAASHNQMHAFRSNSISNSLKPTEWLSLADLESIPSMDEITLEQLEKMPAEEGADLVNKIYHLSQLSQNIRPDYAPRSSEIPAAIVTPNGQKWKGNLNQLVATAKQQPNFGDEEVTIFITGLPQSSGTVSKAANKLVQAYLQRYNGQQQQQQNQKQQQQQQQNNDDSDDSQQSSSSEEDNNNNNNRQANNQQASSGNLVIIDLGATLNTFPQLALLNIEQTGSMIGKLLVQLTNEVDVPQEIIHIVAQGVASHVAGAAGRQFTRSTGHQLRRITALDPSKIYAKSPNTLNGLSRGDADFVDAIHTSAYGMGMPTRVGDVDFYPNGPAVAMPGSDNIIEAAMRATRYFAESVRPGNERNFPAVEANSLQQYKNKNGNGPRAYMGINTDFDVEGDYILQVNSNSPFGKSAPAQKQISFHGAHQPWGMKSQD